MASMLAFSLGIGFWTLLEYLLHRFVFHRYRGIVGSFHHEHHGAPRDRRYLFVRPGFSIASSILLFAIIWVLTRNIAQTLEALAGIWVGYLYYESVHYRVHFSPADGGWIGRQRRAHFRHHFHNSRKWFGVTTPLWDYVFRTTSSD
jgi:sterol desaturase/sphingolipid hydroxylase (fatty acid hydroxylase superfamily)